MRTKAYRKKLMAYLKSATKNCIESVEKIHAIENEKNLLAIVIYQIIWVLSCMGSFILLQYTLKLLKIFFRL